MRTLEWNPSNNALQLIDQRILPARFEIVTCRTHHEVIDAIRNMTVRGAPAIGVTGAFGVALAACQISASNLDAFKSQLVAAAEQVRAARPTAVNLPWAIDRMLRVIAAYNGDIDGLRALMIAEANRMADEDVETNRRMALNGAALIQDGETIIHHCNTGALATVDWGTALGCIRMAHEQGKRVHVLVDETRPRLQGARLTAWELEQYGIPYDIISDGASGYFLHSGQAQRVMFGADRVAANGDVANKVGSYMLALAAHANHVPVYSVFPCTTADLSLKSGDEIPIEERDPDEVLTIEIHGERVTPKGAHARNPAFDVTPHHLFTALVTDRGVVKPPFQENLAKLFAA